MLVLPSCPKWLRFSNLADPMERRGLCEFKPHFRPRHRLLGLLDWLWVIAGVSIRVSQLVRRSGIISQVETAGTTRGRSVFIAHAVIRQIVIQI